MAIILFDNEFEYLLNRWSWVEVAVVRKRGVKVWIACRTSAFLDALMGRVEMDGSTLINMSKESSSQAHFT
jgi:hypothetical protein